MTEDAKGTTVNIGVPDKKWSDDWDAKKDILNVYTVNWKTLSKDYKLANLSAKERELIVEMAPAAQLAYELCPDQRKADIGANIKNELMEVPNMLAILSFNIKGNMIVDRITDYGKEKGETEEPTKKGMAGFFQKLSDRISGKAKLGKAEEEEE